MFHHDGRESEFALDEIADISVNPKSGKTMVSVYTGNPDCEHDWFSIDESVDEAKSLVKEASKLLEEEKQKYKIIEIQ